MNRYVLLQIIKSSIQIANMDGKSNRLNDYYVLMQDSDLPVCKGKTYLSSSSAYKYPSLNSTQKAP